MIHVILDLILQKLGVSKNSGTNVAVVFLSALEAAVLIAVFYDKSIAGIVALVALCDFLLMAAFAIINGLVTP
jgi:hypothetical protein